MVNIGRFYNGRHHTTVLHSIQKVQWLRREDESVEALIEVLTGILEENIESRPIQMNRVLWPSELIETITSRVVHRRCELRQQNAGRRLPGLNSSDDLAPRGIQGVAMRNDRQTLITYCNKGSIHGFRHA